VVQNAASRDAHAKPSRAQPVQTQISATFTPVAQLLLQKHCLYIDSLIHSNSSCVLHFKENGLMHKSGDNLKLELSCTVRAPALPDGMTFSYSVSAFTNPAFIFIRRMLYIVHPYPNGSSDTPNATDMDESPTPLEWTYATVLLRLYRARTST
jgi:hypothetical protein